MRQLSIIFTLLVIFTSCKQSSIKINIETNNIKRTIEIPDVSDEHLMSDLFSNVEYVALESIAGNQIGNIDKALVINDRIYILDKVQNSLFCFEINGRYITCYQNAGRGPNEYKEIIDFDILPEGSGVVILADYNRLLFLDKNMKFQKEIVAPVHANGFLSINRDIFVLYTSRWQDVIDDGTNNLYNLIIHNFNSEEATGLFSNSLAKRIRFSGSSRLYRSSAITYVDPLDDKGHFISESGIDSTWHFDLKNRRIKQADLNLLTSMTDYRNLLMINNGKVSDIRNVYLRGSLVYFTCMIVRGPNATSQTEHQYFFDLKSNCLFPLESTLNDLSSLKLTGFFLGSFENGFFALIPPVLLKQRTFEVLPPSIKDVEIFDNPVIAFYHVKK